VIDLSRGALAMSCLIAGLFFLRFWTESRDRLFLFFATAFWLLAAQWLGLGLVEPAIEAEHPMYLLRLAAYVVLVVGIIDKNRRRRGP
jgi:hypothetical protein